jgi:hypothetical protein
MRVVNVRWRRITLATAGTALLGIATWASCTPIDSPSREELFVIPQGTWARRMAGQDVPLLPDRIHLTLGVRDILVLRNQDDVPQIFGPTLMMPGQSLSLPFDVASEYTFACTAHASGQMLVIVEPNPSEPWERAWWRARQWSREWLSR